MSDIRELLERADGRIDIGKRTGAHTGNEYNIYQIAEELVVFIKANHPELLKDHQHDR